MDAKMLVLLLSLELPSIVPEPGGVEYASTGSGGLASVLGGAVGHLRLRESERRYVLRWYPDGRLEV